MWRKPPIEPRMSVYFFNLTNPREFLQGEKPKFREIGPYVYRYQYQQYEKKRNSEQYMNVRCTKRFVNNKTHQSPSLRRPSLCLELK